MQRTSGHRIDQAARRLAAAALIVALALRLVAGPATMAPPAPGLVAICTGEAIVWLALDPGAGTPAPHVSDPCPVFGFAVAALTVEPPELSPERTVFVAYPPASVQPARALAGPAAYRSRAPPGPGATA